MRTVTGGLFHYWGKLLMELTTLATIEPSGPGCRVTHCAEAGEW